MPEANITWVQNKTFIGTDSTDHSVVISSTADGVGMKPNELLLVSLGSCTAYDVVNILQKKRQTITGLSVHVSGQQNEDPPWAYHSIHIHYTVTGKGLKAKDVEKAIELSEEKYCSVSATVSQAAKITFDFEVIDA